MRYADSKRQSLPQIFAQKERVARLQFLLRAAFMYEARACRQSPNMWQLLPPSAPAFICAVHAVGGVVTAARRVGQRDRRVQRHHLADWACDITDYSVKNHGCLQGSFCKREFVFRWRCVAMQVCVSIDWLAMSERQVRHLFAFGQGQVCAEDLLQEVARLRWSGQQRVAYRSPSGVLLPGPCTIYSDCQSGLCYFGGAAVSRAAAYVVCVYFLGWRRMRAACSSPSEQSPLHLS